MRNYTTAERKAILKVAKIREAKLRDEAWLKLSKRTGRSVKTIKSIYYYIEKRYGTSRSASAKKPRVKPIVSNWAVLKRKIMNTQKNYLVQMDYGYGKSDKSWLEAEIHNDTIFFKRNKDGVHAWHCNAINIKDHRVLDIKSQS